MACPEGVEPPTTWFSIGLPDALWKESRASIVESYSHTAASECPVSGIMLGNERETGLIYRRYGCTT